MIRLIPAHKLITFLIVTFWGAMNVLLFRAEFCPSMGTSEISPELVLKKILSSQSRTDLNIRHRNNFLGVATWSTTIIQAPSENAHAAAQEGMVLNPVRYLASLDLAIYLRSIDTKFRVELSMDFSMDLELNEANLRLRSQHVNLEIDANSATRQISICTWMPGSEGKTNRFSLDEVQNPDTILAAILPPQVSDLIESSGDVLPLPLINAQTAIQQSTRVQTKAYATTLKLRKGTLKVYLLNLRFGEYEVRIYADRAGEILKIELPLNLTLENKEIFLDTLAR